MKKNTVKNFFLSCEIYRIWGLLPCFLFFVLKGKCVLIWRVPRFSRILEMGFQFLVLRFGFRFWVLGLDIVIAIHTRSYYVINILYIYIHTRSYSTHVKIIYM